MLSESKVEERRDETRGVERVARRRSRGCADDPELRARATKMKERKRLRFSDGD